LRVIFKVSSAKSSSCGIGVAVDDCVIVATGLEVGDFVGGIFFVSVGLAVGVCLAVGDCAIVGTSVGLSGVATTFIRVMAGAGIVSGISAACAL